MRDFYQWLNGRCGLQSGFLGTLSRAVQGGGEQLEGGNNDVGYWVWAVDYTRDDERAGTERAVNRGGGKWQVRTSLREMSRNCPGSSIFFTRYILDNHPWSQRPQDQELRLEISGTSSCHLGTINPTAISFGNHTYTAYTQAGMSELRTYH